MKVILTGGGTGGHIYPAIAIADKIKKMNSDAQVLFVGTEKGLESELVPKNGYDIKFITVSGFNRHNLLKNIKVVKEMFEGSAQAKEIVKEFKPDLVIGTGGYVCGPVVRIAAKMGIPCFIHEQNAFAGLTNKMLEKYVKKVFLGFEEASKYFKQKDKLVFTGNPVRNGFFDLNRQEIKDKLGLRQDEFTVLCFGGSRGASKINDVMLEVANALAGVEDIRLFFVTGSTHYDAIRTEAASKGIAKHTNIEFKRYIDDMPIFLGASDLVICRSGALTVAELMVAGRTAVLIPSPNVTGNHQYYNAKAITDAGGAKLIIEKELTADRILDIISKLKTNLQLRNEMELASSKAGKNSAVDEIYKCIMEYIEEH